MPALRPDQVNDLVEKTLSTYEREVYTDVSLDLQEYVGCDYFLNSNNEKLKTGPDCRFKLRYTNPGNAGMSGLFAVDQQINAKKTITEGFTDWYKSWAGMTYDVDEPMFQGGSDNEQIIDTLKERLHGAMNDYFELIEPFFWTAGSSGQNRFPGMVDYIVKDTTTTGDFLGGNPAGYSSGVAGIDSNTYDGYQNWAGKYEAITQKDLFRRVRVACAKTTFKAPRKYPELKKGSDRVVIFTTLRASTEIEEQLENRNDNLGKDGVRFSGEAMLKSNPVVWVPYLENNDMTDPLYGVNFAYLYAQIHKDINMKRSEPIRASSNQDTTMIVKWRRWLGLACPNRRRHWVLSKVAA